MDKNRGILVVGASFAVLAAAAALTYLVRERNHANHVRELGEVEHMIDEYEAYVEREAPPKPVRKRTSHAKNGKAGLVG